MIIYIYIYIFIWIYFYTYIYIYIFFCIYIYEYIYMAGFRLSGFNKISRQVAAKFARGNIYNLRLGI